MVNILKTIINFGKIKMPYQTTLVWNLTSQCLPDTKEEDWREGKYSVPVIVLTEGGRVMMAVMFKYDDSDLAWRLNCSEEWAIDAPKYWAYVNKPI